MNALLVFACIFGPIFVLTMLSSGRDQLLFLDRPRSHRVLKALVIVAAIVALVALGVPPKWALALVLPGPLGSAFGNWVGSGEWIVLRHRAQWLLRRGD